MPGTLSSPILVGRATELLALDAALRRAEAGTPAIVLIAGDAGLGKTRLVDEFAAAARQSGARVLIGGCVDLGGEGVPYGPFLEALRALGRELQPDALAELLGEVGPELVAVAPGFARFLTPLDDSTVAAGAGGTAAGGTSPPAGGPTDQARLFELTLALVDRLSSDRPLVLVLEDLHWSDPATRDLLGFLARNLTQGRVMLVATFRSEDVERGHPLLVRLAEIARNPLVERLDLRPLDLAEQREQLAAILGRRPARGVVERIHARSEGNPFFAEEIVASRLGNDDVDPDPGAMPRSLRDILIGRVARLSDSAQRILGAVAVAGSRADEELLATVTDLPEGELIEAIREAVARHVLEVDETAGTYRLRHALLSEVVYADLLPGERRRLHDAVAHWLAEPAARDGTGARERRGTAAELAHHWFAADNLAESLRASVDAADAATAVHAHADALRHLRRAIDLWGRVGDPEAIAGVDRATLLDRASQAADRDGQGSLAVELAREMIAAVDESAEPTRAGVMRSKLAFFLWTTGQTQVAVNEYRAAVALVPRRAAIGRAGAGARRSRGDVAGGGSLPRIPRDHRGGPRHAPCHRDRTRASRGCSTSSGWTWWVSAMSMPGSITCGSPSRIARETGALDAQLGAQHNLAFFLSQTDRFEEGLRVAMDGLDDRRAGRPRAALRGGHARERGRHPEAIRALGRGGAHDRRLVGTAATTRPARSTCWRRESCS